MYKLIKLREDLELNGIVFPKEYIYEISIVPHYNKYHNHTCKYVLCVANRDQFNLNWCFIHKFMEEDAEKTFKIIFSKAKIVYRGKRKLHTETVLSNYKRAKRDYLALKFRR